MLKHAIEPQRHVLPNFSPDMYIDQVELRCPQITVARAPSALVPHVTNRRSMGHTWLALPNYCESHICIFQSHKFSYRSSV